MYRVNPRQPVTSMEDEMGDLIELASRRKAKARQARKPRKRLRNPVFEWCARDLRVLDRTIERAFRSGGGDRIERLVAEHSARVRAEAHKLLREHIARAEGLLDGSEFAAQRAAEHAQAERLLRMTRR
ncbi:hypothetical protein [Rhodomicrobium lacus]|uniref:hypothetical protein n=1 Tax=Rhodomicrobium lacus TaxID=2498452 RepID=UPI0026E2F770|nr:hypothetical protein [Rhodomicrobium lacus]WKW52027.1 hypothetical protein QMO75_05980 [Rhodomicrobium lacus]